MKMKIQILFFLLLFLNGNLWSQVKREFEQRITVSEVPERARAWFKSTYGNPSKVKWYREITTGKLSYEAKLKRNKKWHSVEFDSLGVVEDVEIKIRKKEIPKETREIIWSYFKSNYTKSKVSKIQLQWSGDENDLSKAIIEKKPDKITVRFEIEFYGKNQKEDEMWEGLFSDEGELLKRRKIILRPTDNLTY